MTGLYFSGTGNTRRCVEQFTAAVDNNAECFSIEEQGVTGKLPENGTIVFGFPIYYSNVPKIVKDFITRNSGVWAGKKVFIITTKGLFNAFGVGYAVKMFKSFGAEFIGSLQLNMPDNIRDLKIMEIVFTKNYKRITAKADAKIAKAAAGFKAGKRAVSGLSPFNYIIGLFLKILPFYPKTDDYIAAPKVDKETCTGCGKCAALCPMKNIAVVGKTAVSGEKCTVCYRCFGNCPAQALTILGGKVYNQYTFDDSFGAKL